MNDKWVKVSHHVVKNSVDQEFIEIMRQWNRNQNIYRKQKFYNEWDNMNYAENIINSSISSLVIWKVRIISKPNGSRAYWAVGIYSLSDSCLCNTKQPNKQKSHAHNIGGILNDQRHDYYLIQRRKFRERPFCLNSSDKKWNKKYRNSLLQCRVGYKGLHWNDMWESGHILVILLDTNLKTLRFAHQKSTNEPIDWISEEYNDIQCGKGIYYRLCVSIPIQNIIAGRRVFKIVNFKQTFLNK